MKKCAFCAKSFKEVQRANEHILKKSWLSKLDLHDHPVSNLHFRREIPGSEEHAEPVGVRSMGARSVLAGNICMECNSGWMNDLDMEVENTVLAAATGAPLLHLQLGREDLVKISRWIFKLACCVDSNDPVPRRRISPQVMERMKDSGYLPSGFVAYFCEIPGMPRAVGYTLSDFWIPPGNPPLMTPAAFRLRSKIIRTSRIKFAVQYNKLIIGCTYLDIPRPYFVLRSEIHNAMWANGADWGWDHSREPFYMPTLFERSHLNVAASTIQVMPR